MPPSIPLERIAAIILAAGYSSRMGTLKPLIEIEGATMLEHAACTFVNAGIEHVAVVTGFGAEYVATLARAHGLIPIHNPHFDRGMFNSILAGISAIPENFEAAFILPVDIPFVSPDTARALTRGIGERPAALPRYHCEPGHPPLIRRAWFEPLREWTGPDGLRGFFRAHKTEIASIEVDDPFILRDIDSPRDLERLVQKRPRA